MALYTFYPCHRDGGSDTFVCAELDSDQEARVHALQILDQHPTATQVTVWCGERKVHTRARMDATLKALLSR